jgi:hypothetical protein
MVYKNARYFLLAGNRIVGKKYQPNRKLVVSNSFMLKQTPVSADHLYCLI